MALVDVPPRLQRIRAFGRLHTNYVSCLAFCPDGSLLASAGADGGLVIINVRRQLSILYVDMGKPLYTTCIIWPQPDLLIMGQNDGGVQILRVNPKVRSSNNCANGSSPTLPDPSSCYIRVRLALRKLLPN